MIAAMIQPSDCEPVSGNSEADTTVVTTAIVVLAAVVVVLAVVVVVVSGSVVVVVVVVVVDGPTPLVRPSTCEGVDLSTVVASPSCPYELLPQHCMAPVDSNAQV